MSAADVAAPAPVAVKSPKAPKARKAPKSPKVVLSHPRYYEMVNNAVKDLAEKKVRVFRVFPRLFYFPALFLLLRSFLRTVLFILQSLG